MLRVSILVIACLFLCPECLLSQQSKTHAKLVIADDLLMRCAIGEASGEGLLGMTAIVESIRNRKTVKGVYGCKARHVDQESKTIVNLARKAVEASKHSNLVKGADHWENINSFGKPYWVKTMLKTARVGNHTFYKSRHNKSSK